MIVDHTYSDALKAVESAYGPATGYGCIRCTDFASCWVVDNRIPAVVAPDMRRYSRNPRDYWPMCARCAQAYDLMGDEAGPVFRRVSTFAEPHWFASCFVLDAEGSVLLRDAYATYVDFCGETRTPVTEIMTRNTFKAAILRHGLKARRTNSGVALIGARLRTSC